jgi:hypothetical protein
MLMLLHGPRGHYWTSRTADGRVDLEVSHTCPICHSGPLIGLPDEGIMGDGSVVVPALNRFTCNACLPKLAALGYSSVELLGR